MKRVIYTIAILCLSLLGMHLTFAATFTTPFTTPGNYTFDTTKVEVLNGKARIKSKDISVSVNPNPVILGTVTASSTYNTNQAKDAFDNDINTKGWGNNNTSSSWLQYDFGSGNTKIITGYTLYRNSSQEGGWTNNYYSPKDWTFEASNDGTNWTVLDTQTNQSVLNNQPKKAFTFSNTTAYRYYRINITKNSTILYDWVNITEMELLESGTDITIVSAPILISHVSASSIHNASQPNANQPKDAFDDNTTTKGWGNNQILPAWLQYDFGSGSAKTITAYSLYRNSNQEGGWTADSHAPKDWTFEASNDGTNWTVLDTQTNQSVLNNQPKKTFTFSNTTAYRYYRINITANKDGIDNWVNITEMELFEVESGAFSVIKTAGNSAAHISAFSGFSVGKGTMDGNIAFQLSENGTDWKYWDGSSWTSATVSQNNTESEVNIHIPSFPTTSNAIFVKSFLTSTGGKRVEIDTINIQYVDQVPIFDSITLSSNNTKNTAYAKAGDKIKITLALQSADTWKFSNNKPTFSIGATTGLQTANYLGSTSPKISGYRNYTILSGQNGELTFTALEFKNKNDADITNFTVPYIPTSNIIVDTIAPIITFNDNVSATATATDTIQISVSDDHPDTTSYKYGFSSDSTCDNTDTYGNTFTSGTNFSIANNINNGKYICVKAEDMAGNISYKASTNTLNINTSPIVQPNTINDLVLWLDADDSNTLFSDNACNTAVSNGSKVGCWKDKSGQNNDVKQSDNNDKPTYNTNILNTKPVLDFINSPSGNDDHLATVNAGQITANGSYTKFVVFAYDDLTSHQNLISSNTTGSALWGAGDGKIHTWNVPPSYSGIGFLSSPNQLNTSQYYIVSTRYDNVVGDGVKSILRLDGTQLDTDDTIHDHSSQKIFIGSHGPNHGLDGKIAEALVYNRGLSDSEIAAIEEYLNKKWFNHIPTNITLSNNSITENTIVVGNFTTSDADTSNTHTYTLVNGTGSEDNAKFTLTNTGGLSFSSAPDFENPTDIGDTANNNTYTIRVKTTDNGTPNLSFEKSFIITVTNANETRTLADKTFSVAENASNNTSVGTMTGSDVDSGSTLVYSIASGNTGSVFAISGSTGEITISDNTNLDYETISSYTLTIKVSDGSLTTTATATINITDIDEIAPTITTIVDQTYRKNSAITPIAITTDDATAIITVSGLPAGLIYNTVTQKIEGIPTTPNTPTGTTVTITATDLLGNRSRTTFVFTIQEIITSGSSRRSGKIRKDSCPDGDKSPSYYDGSCGEVSEEEGDNEEGIDASDESQKDKGEREEVETAYEYAKRLGITTIPTFEKFNATGVVLRKDMAKMMSIFKMKELKKNKAVMGDECKRYQDIDDLSEEYKVYIESSCRLGIMGLNGNQDGVLEKFNPEGIVSRAEFGTILSRTLRGKKYAKTENSTRYENHLKALQLDKIMKYIDQPWNKELRGWVITMLFRIHNK